MLTNAFNKGNPIVMHRSANSISHIAYIHSEYCEILKITKKAQDKPCAFSSIVSIW